MCRTTSRTCVCVFDITPDSDFRCFVLDKGEGGVHYHDLAHLESKSTDKGEETQVGGGGLFHIYPRTYYHIVRYVRKHHPACFPSPHFYDGHLPALGEIASLKTSGFGLSAEYLSSARVFMRKCGSFSLPPPLCFILFVLPRRFFFRLRSGKKCSNASKRN